MTFDDMRSTLKKLFAENSHIMKDPCVEIQFESDVLCSNNSQRWLGTKVGSASCGKPKNSYVEQNLKEALEIKGELNADGSISVCTICES